MRALIGLLILGCLFVMAASWQNRTTAELQSRRTLRYAAPADAANADSAGWSRLVLGRPSGSDPLPLPASTPAAAYMDPNVSTALGAAGAMNVGSTGAGSSGAGSTGAGSTGAGPAGAGPAGARSSGAGSPGAGSPGAGSPGPGLAGSGPSGIQRTTIEETVAPRFARDFEYIVKPNDSLSVICQKHYEERPLLKLVEAVALYNDLKSPNAIRAGKTILLPDAAVLFPDR